VVGNSIEKNPHLITELATVKNEFQPNF